MKVDNTDFEIKKIMGTPIHAAKEMGWYKHLRKGCDYLLRFNMNIPYDLVITLYIFSYVCICI